MEKLKVVLMAGLFWTFIIWFARTMKRKAVEEHRKFEGKNAGNGIGYRGRKVLHM